MRNAHGRRTIENFAHYIPTLKGAELEDEVKRFEGRVLVIADEIQKRAESTGQKLGLIVAMPGARELVREVRASSPPC